MQEVAEQEKSALAAVLQHQMGLTLSPEKTLVTPVTSTIRFLGHHLRVRPRPSTRQLVPRLVIPKDRTTRLRQTISGIFDRATLNETLENRLKLVNPVLRGWGNFYRHAWGAKRVFTAVDHHVWCTILRWLRKKHPRTAVRDLKRQYGWYRPRQRMLRWHGNGVVVMPLSSLRVVRYQQGADPGPSYA